MKSLPVIAARLLAVKDKLDRRFEILLREAAPALAAAKSQAEVETIMQSIVDSMVGILDQEEIAALDEARPPHPDTVRH